MLPIGLALTGVSALAGLFGKPKEQKTTTNSTQTQNIDQTNMPQYDATTLDARNRILGTLFDRVEAAPNMYNNYVQSGLNSINSTDAARQRIMNNLLSSRGFGSSPSSTVARGMGQNYRLGLQSNLLTEAPLKIDQLQQDRLKDLAGFFTSLPVGSHQTGQNTTTSNSTTIGNPNVSGAGSALTSAATTAAGLFGQRGNDWWK